MRNSEIEMFESEYGCQGDSNKFYANNRLKAMADEKISSVYEENKFLFNVMDSEFELDNWKEKKVGEFLEACSKMKK